MAIKILLVDDSAFMCNALKRELRAADIEAVSATSGHDALALISREKFDVVITDVMMPEMGGEELIQHLGKIAPGLPCIALTGNAETDEVRRIAKAPNLAGILVKPWNKKKMIDTIRLAVDQHTVTPAKAK